MEQTDGSYLAQWAAAGGGQDADPGRVVWVTGAGSGMGRASALRAARAGRRVAVSGRRPEAVAATVADIEAAGGVALAVPLDVRDRAAVARAHSAIESAWGPVADLVLAAGLNAPHRGWEDQDLDGFTAIVETNLTGVVSVVDAVLPGMRAAGGGTIVVVSSWSAWRFTPTAGVAYSASKTALASVCATLNDEEGVHGIRVCHLCPGDVDTDFLQLRPQVPGAEARAAMLSPDDIAETVQFVLDRPANVRINELVVSPVRQR